MKWGEIPTEIWFIGNKNIKFPTPKNWNLRETKRYYYPKTF